MRPVSLRFAVVGYGTMGRHHTRNLGEMDGVEIVGVVETVAASRDEAARAGLPTFAAISDLGNLAIDAAIICVPTSEHESIAHHFIERHCAVLIEKPIGLTMHQGWRIIDHAQSRNVCVMVGYVERYNPAITELRRFIHEGNIGQILTMSARRVGAFPPRIRDANVIIDMGVHDIDMAAFIISCPLNLIAAQGGRGIQEDRIDYASLVLEADGISIDIVTNWLTPVKIRDLSITGTRGYCHVDYMTQRVLFMPGRSFSPSNSYEALVAQYIGSDTVQLPVISEEPLKLELQAFARGIKGGSLPNPALALESLRIAQEATAEIEGRISQRTSQRMKA